jgi:hypothetical protein
MYIVKKFVEKKELIMQMEMVQHKETGVYGNVFWGMEVDGYSSEC